ncbi:516_t:CDS:2, partial [Gigaspora rosea]
DTNRERNLPDKDVIGVDYMRCSLDNINSGLDIDDVDFDVDIDVDFDVDFDVNTGVDFNMDFNVDFDVNTSVPFSYKNMGDTNHEQNLPDKNVIGTDNIRCSLGQGGVNVDGGYDGDFDVDFDVNTGVELNINTEMNADTDGIDDSVEDEFLLNDVEMSHKIVTIEEGQSFGDFDEAENHVRNYTEYMGFMQANPKKPGKTVRKGCQWHINLSRPLKQNPNDCVFVTTFKKFKKKYLLQPVYTKDLYAEIQQYIESAQDNRVDAARFYEELQAKKQEYPRWFIEVTWEVLRGRLGDSFADFYSSFLNCRNADSPDAFYHYWEELIKNYPAANSFNDNTKQKQYEELIKGIPSTVNTITIFPQIESIIGHYLQPNVARFLVGQMKESVYYISFRSNIEEIKNMPVNKPSESDNFEDEPDGVFLCAQFLLQQLDCTKIEEVWKVSRVTRQD